MVDFINIRHINANPLKRLHTASGMRQQCLVVPSNLRKEGSCTAHRPNDMRPAAVKIGLVTRYAPSAINSLPTTFAKEYGLRQEQERLGRTSLRESRRC